MDIQAISTLISTLGFPIAACIYMAIINQKQSQSHKEEMTKMTDAIDSLKIAIVTLTERLNKN